MSYMQEYTVRPDSKGRISLGAFAKGIIPIPIIK